MFQGLIMAILSYLAAILGKELNAATQDIARGRRITITTDDEVERVGDGKPK
jgi:hypothetical protein